MNTGAVGCRELVVDGRLVMVHVRESRRARRMRLVVAPGRAPEVVVPARSRHRVVDAFLHSNQRWLSDKLAALQVLAQRPRALQQLPGAVWIAGEPIRVLHDPAGSSPALHHGWLVVSGAPSDAGAAVARWYRREAHRRLNRGGRPASLLTTVLERNASAESVRSHKFEDLEHCTRLARPLSERVRGLDDPEARHEGGVVPG